MAPDEHPLACRACRPLRDGKSHDTADRQRPPTGEPLGIYNRQDHARSPRGEGRPRRHQTRRPDRVRARALSTGRRKWPPRKGLSPEPSVARAHPSFTTYSTRRCSPTTSDRSSRRASLRRAQRSALRRVARCRNLGARNPPRVVSPNDDRPRFHASRSLG